MLYLASGTDDGQVKEEASALDISRYFGPRMYGARDDGGGFTKAALVRYLLAEEGYKPAELVAFGDGFVEINEVSKSCGLAVGVADRRARMPPGRRTQTQTPDCCRRELHHS